MLVYQRVFGGSSRGMKMDICYFGQQSNLVIDDGEIPKAEKWLFLGGGKTWHGGSKLPLDLYIFDLYDGG